ncbi:hypothetical protein SS50377_21042 [Spironucleus salmonicida]|uniref:Uncharacterized protein n=1 Tax=Spironucleus salmonicida TaxID=348837 RepID=V6LJ47_9EUKA|nr:hypothetical protein SS50377_21042 [Spironucleus salmonicida]|eukprot:EST43701.1 Hypothetical protein SS50377_16754 [Spironucleus salmonicida]
MSLLQQLKLKLRDGSQKESVQLLSQFHQKIQSERQQIDDIMNETCEEVQSVRLKLAEIREQHENIQIDNNLNINIELVSLKKSNKYLEKQIGNYQLQVAGLKAQNATLTDQKIEISNINMQLEKTLYDLKSTDMEHHDIISKLKADIIKHQQHIEQESVLLSTYQDQIQILQLENETITQEIFIQSENIKDKQAENDKLLYQSNSNNLAIAQLTEDLADAQLGMVDVQQMQKRINILQMNNRQLEQQLLLVKDFAVEIKQYLQTDKIKQDHQFNDLIIDCQNSVDKIKNISYRSAKNINTTTTIAESCQNIKLEINQIKNYIILTQELASNTTLYGQLELILVNQKLLSDNHKSTTCNTLQEIQQIKTVLIPELNQQFNTNNKYMQSQFKNIEDLLLEKQNVGQINYVQYLKIINEQLSSFSFQDNDLVDQKLSIINQQLQKLSSSLKYIQSNSENNIQKQSNQNNICQSVTELVVNQLQALDIMNIDSLPQKIIQINNKMQELETKLIFIYKSQKLQKQILINDIEQPQINPFEERYIEVKTLLQKLQEVKQKTDSENLNKIRELTRQQNELELLLGSKEQISQNTQTEGIPLGNDLINQKLQQQILQLNQELDQLFQEKNDLVTAQTSIQVHSLSNYSNIPDFIQFYTVPHYEPDTILLSPQELDTSRIDMLKSLKTKRLLKKTTLQMFSQAYKELNYLFTDKDISKAIAQQFRITFSDESSWYLSLRNFIVSKFNIAMERFLSVYVEDIFLSISPGFLGVIKSDERNQFFMIFNILLQFILNGYEISQYQAGVGKTLVFPQLTKQGEKTISALQIKNEELGI